MTSEIRLISRTSQRLINRSRDFAGAANIPHMDGNDHEGLKRRISQRLEELNISARAASIKAGGSPDLIRGVLRGANRTFRGDHLMQVASVLGVTQYWLLTGEGDAPSDPPASQMIPVVGYVGAGAEVFCIDDHAKGAGLDEVEAPLPGMSRSSVAVRVRGNSMEPAFYDGDLIFYDRNDNGDLMHLIGKECVVSLGDGRKFIKILKRRANGDWYLHSNNAEPIMDIEIEWAAKVGVIKRA